MGATQGNTFGDMLRHWRAARRISQLALGLEAGVSARHISFMETGRSNPSPEMILALAEVLDVPLRERNTLLHSAGYAPIYRETNLNDPQMTEARRALELILKQQEPCGAVAFDRHWDIVMANEAYVRFVNLLLGERLAALSPFAVTSPPRHNLVRMTFDPAGLRPFITNWEVVARSMLARLHREATWTRDESVRALLNTVLSYPGVPAHWREPDFTSSHSVIIPLEMRFHDRCFRSFSTITTLGSPQDITLQELRIETFHPANETIM